MANSNTGFVSPRRLEEYNSGAVTPLYSSIAGIETSPAQWAHTAGSFLYYSGGLYKVKAAIDEGDTLTVGTNIERVTVSDVLRALSSLSVASQSGANGIRYYNEKLEYWDGSSWVEIETGGGGIQGFVTPPTISGAATWVYDGAEHAPTLSGLDTDLVEVGGTVKSTNAGEFTITLTLKNSNSYVWTDLTNAPKTLTWSITKATLAVPMVTGTAKTYNGQAQHPTVTGFDPGTMTMTGYEYTNVGNYTLAFTLKDADNYQWGSSTTSFQWGIAKRTITVPTVTDTSKTYNGSAQHPTVAGYDSTTMTRTGYEYTDAGSYTLAFALKDTDNNQWGSGSTSVSWSIAKANGAATLSKSSVSLTADSPTATVTVSGNTGSVGTPTSSDSGVATASVSGSTVTITAVATGSCTISIPIAASTNYKATTKTVSVEASMIMVYGAEWDGTASTAWSRTDAAALFTDPVPAVSNGSGSSPFDGIQPWAGMVKSERTGGTMVSIPKFYYSLTQNGNGMKIRISENEFDGSSVSPAHMDRGDGKGERDVVYVGRYHCASDYKSKTGGKPVANVTRANARANIHNLGSNIWQMDFATRFTIWLLYIVEFADWNSQAKIGYGCGNNSATENMGYTDSMQYHTGTKLSSRTTYGLGTQYRWIEGLWDNVLDWLDGCYNNSNGLNLILNPSNFSDSTGGTAIGVPSNGYPSKFAVKTNGQFPMFIPTEASGGEASFSCDSWYFYASYPCLCAGGVYLQNPDHGLFCVYYAGASSSSASLGCRLLELP